MVFIEFMDSPDPSIKKTSSGLAEYFFLKLELISLILFLDALCTSLKYFIKTLIKSSDKLDLGYLFSNLILILKY